MCNYRCFLYEFQNVSFPTRGYRRKLAEIEGFQAFIGVDRFRDAVMVSDVRTFRSLVFKCRFSVHMAAVTNYTLYINRIFFKYVRILSNVLEKSLSRFIHDSFVIRQLLIYKFYNVL